MAAGDADMVGLCRALIVDPEWPAKAKRGEAERIRTCIACNQCWGWISEGAPIACATNPVAGERVALAAAAKDCRERREGA